MKRTIVRFQLVLLVIAVGLIFFRAMDGPRAPEGTLVLHKLREGDLAVRTLRLTGPAQPVAVEAIGSFASPDARHLEAYAWIVDRRTREVVWQMSPQRSQRTRGTVAEMRDTVVMEPGVYEAYFTSLGSGEPSRTSGLFGSSNRWRNNASHWRFILHALGEPALARSERTERTSIGPRPPGLLWTTAPDDGDDRATTTLLVQRPATVTVYAVGSFQPAQSSPLVIQPVNGGAPVWTLPVADAVPAGGAPSNRAYRGNVTLQPGLYQVIHVPSDDGWDNWDVNPPLDPAAWGVTLSSSDSTAIRHFKPFETVQPAIAILQPGDDEDRYVSFRVAEPTAVLAFGMGELTGENSRYDYGWIEAETGARVWEMEYDDSRHAGGAGKNRQLQEWITLAPGAYRLRFRSDDSHSYDRFNDSEPDHPERWGVALFTERPGVLVKGEEGRSAMAPPPPPPLPGEVERLADQTDVPAPPSTEDALVALLRTGNGQSLDETFEVAAAGPFQIYALGELRGDQRYDYAVLRDAQGRIVWEMTEANTRPAGGNERNRVFSGVVTLEPGRYTLHYETDASHSFADFSSGDAPAYPHAWGAIIRPATD